MLEDKKHITPDEDTAHRHTVIVRYFFACLDELTSILRPFTLTGPTDFAPSVGDRIKMFESIRGCTQLFIVKCEQVAPKSADLSAAVRCIRVARMIANQVVSDSFPAQAAKHLTHVENLLWEARVQACEAIDFAKPNELPDLE